jgi:plasmid maintenance system antidote protein VapI
MAITFPSDPVVALLDERFHSDRAAAEHLGVARETILRWRNEGVRIGGTLADVIAIKLGRHPVELWPEWPETWIELEDRQRGVKRAKNAKRPSAVKNAARARKREAQRAPREGVRG